MHVHAFSRMHLFFFSFFFVSFFSYGWREKGVGDRTQGPLKCLQYLGSASMPLRCPPVCTFLIYADVTISVTYVLDRTGSWDDKQV